MSLDDSNREILPFKSYEINVNNPVALKKKKSEKEQIIKPRIDFNYDNNKKDIIIQEKENQVTNNNQNDVNEETQRKKNEINPDNQQGEEKIEISKGEPEKIAEKPKIQEVQKEEKNEEKKDEKVENKEIKKEENKVKGLKQIENIKLKNGQKKEEKKNEKNKNKKEKEKEEIKFKKKIKNDKNEVDKKELKNQNSDKKNNLPPNKENKEELPKTLLTKKTEDNYDLLKNYFKGENYKRGDDEIIDEIINYKDFSSDKFLGFVSEKKILDIENKKILEDFLQRNTDDTKIRQDNNKTINDRIKLIDESTKKKLYFNNKQSQQEFYDSFYNKQIQYKNSCKEHLDKLAQKYDDEINKNCIPEPKNKNNLDYFKNNEPVKISKYSFKAKNYNKIEINGQNPKENSKENENEKLNTNKNIAKLKYKKMQSFNPDASGNDNSCNHMSNTNDNILNNSKNNKNTIETNNNKTENKETKKLKKIKSGPLLKNNGIKLSKKEIDEITNKLHYDGELLKVKKQININEDNVNKSKKCNFSEEKLTHSSIIILIKKLLFEYCTAIANNVYIDYTENPKLNYDQYIDIFKDLYYIERDAPPDDYLEEDTIYKELWNKLILFSSGPENSIESNVLLLYLLELNGFFSNEKIIKELKNEINWIKLEDYDDLIANAKYIEENWRDLKTIKIEYIKRLKLEGIYNPIHCQELYNNNSNNKNNKNQIFKINITNNNDDKNHYITTLKGNTNYHLIHGYSKKNKNSENNSLFDFTNLFNENEENKHSTLSISNITNKNNGNSNNNTKNRIPLKDSYKDLIIKKKKELENRKKDEELKLKEICTFKPQINTVNKNLFSKKKKIELPKHKKNKSVITNNNNSNSFTQENNNSNINNNNISNQQKNNPINNNNKNNQNNLKRNKSSLQKMFTDNPLKKDKAYNEKLEKIKMAKMNGKEFENYNNYLLPAMRFDIEYPSKFESLGITINRDANLRQRTHNVIFYNIKVNEKMKILKYNEGDDLKLNVINFVRKNNLPEEVIDIILTKIKEKTIEEIL